MLAVAFKPSIRKSGLGILMGLGLSVLPPNQIDMLIVSQR